MNDDRWPLMRKRERKKKLEHSSEYANMSMSR